MRRLEPSVPVSSLGTPLAVIVHAPPGTRDWGLARAVAEAGGVGVVDLVGLADADRARLFRAVPGVAGGRGAVGVRVDPADDAALAPLLDVAPGGTLGVVILAPRHPGASFAPYADTIARLHFAGLAVLAETRDENASVTAAHAGATGIVVRLDDHGTADERAARILQAVHDVQAGVDVPLFAHGGVGPEGIEAIRRAGAEGVVFDVQTWFVPEASLPADRHRGLTQHPDHAHAVRFADLHDELDALLRAAGGAARAHAVNQAGPRPAPSPALAAVDTHSVRSTASSAGPAAAAPSPAATPTPRAATTAPSSSSSAPTEPPIHQEVPIQEPSSMESLPPTPQHDPSTTDAPVATTKDASSDDEPIDLAEGIAVIGYGCVLPKANNVAAFWQNVHDGVDAIIEVPEGRWDTSLFYDPEGREDKSYTKIGGFVTDFRFDPLAFRIPPKSADALDVVQQMTLTATREAFLSAGLLDEKLKPVKDFDRERTAVILGNSMGGEVQRAYTRRISWPKIESDLRGSTAVQALDNAAREAFIKQMKTRWLSVLPPITEDSMPGELSNVVAGRVANVFDLKGKNHTADAACASSFAALDAAVKGLVERDFDMVVTGGADRSMDIDTYVKFCKIGALSATGSTPFDARADGFVMGEGAAVFILKRLSDAVRDGDHIHAVLRGVGSSSDGKGKGITAPNQRGQVLAVARGLKAAGFDAPTVQYVEAHGTSTKVGDVVELESLAEAFGARALAPRSVAVGSVKSQIGHLKSAAGAAALLKVVLALEHNTIPPSINFETPNPNVDWDSSPFRVPSKAEPWPENTGGAPRRAGISSFGFGGTNFHVLLEEYVPELHDQKPVAATRPATRRPETHYLPTGTRGPAVTAVEPDARADPETIRKHLAARAHLEGETLVLGGPDQKTVVRRLHEVANGFAEASPFYETGQGPRLKDLVYPHNVLGIKADVRVALVCKDLAQVREQARFALSCLDDPARMRMAPVKGVFAGQGVPKGKVAFLFPGQGSQYAEMLVDLYDKYAVVRDTFTEADAIMEPLIEAKLTDLIFPAYTPGDDAARKQAIQQAEESLRQTEICQPAVLTADIALWRLLRSLGIEPDVVAGHSLGEYAALVAAGIIRFEDALLAVSARGKEMANVNVPDLGKMASITAPFEHVERVLAECTEYVIPANKNCPAMTVIAGSSAGVDEAVARFTTEGIQATYIPVSAAFHSGIVAPASEPLRNVLSKLSIRPPHTPIYANVTARPYEVTGDARAFKEYVLDMLAKQVASPVEWSDTIRGMYADGVRLFVEVGPKRALTGFVTDILKGEEHVAVAANHPKKGGVYHLNETFAVVAAAGRMPKVKRPDAVAHYTPEHLHPLADLPRTTGAPTVPSPPTPDQPSSATPANAAVKTDPLAEAISTDELRALARDDGFVRYAREQAPIVSAMLRAGYESARAAGGLPPLAVPSAASAATAPRLGTDASRPGFAFDTEDVVISGASIGLPGRGHHVFDDANIDRILAGENCIDPLTETERGRMTDKHIVRLTKGGDGSAGFEAIKETSQVIKLAARLGAFDLEKEFGIDHELTEVLDITSRLAIGAAIDALRDAGIPLVRPYRKTSTGSYLPTDWALPAALQDETGIIFASAFPGYDALVEEVSRHLADRYAHQTHGAIENLVMRLSAAIRDDHVRHDVERFGKEALADLDRTDATSLAAFNRKFLFYVLSMGHSQLAQLIKAKGPNTQVNAACSSTTQAVAIAEDWIRLGRCRRVIIVGADAATSDRLMEWIGSGFLASGAATTEEDVRNAALPFDRRRHGMIIGSGAVGLVVEARSETKKRGMDGLVRILATQVANSAFHGSRLDVDHIASQMDRLVQVAEDRYGFDRSAGAKDTIFMSHETYTPARGGSASAEVESLRRTFGPHADQVVVANTKGFTGHPMGAGIEDAIAIKSLQLGRVPPIANLRELDPELGGLNLSKGGATDARYTLRLAAGFGSQIALWLGERLTKGTKRVVDETAHQAWLRQVSGQDAPTLEVVQRTLRVVDGGRPEREPLAAETGSTPAPERPTVQPDATPAITPAAPRSPTPRPTPAPTPVTPPAATVTPPAASAPGRDDIVSRIIEIIVEKTGYPADMLEPDLDLEADLGIDTVKQAELFGVLRETYALPQEEGIQIKDYPTLNHLADYISSRLGARQPAPQPVQGDEPQSQTAPPTTTPEPAATPEPRAAPPPAPPTPVPYPNTTTDTTTDSNRVTREDVLQRIVGLLAEQTGYPADMLEPDLDLEADLGIDTVKQAELFGLIRDTYALPQEEGIQIKDYPTLNHLAAYITERATQSGAPAGPGPSPPSPSPEAPSPHAAEPVRQATLDDMAPTRATQPAAKPTPASDRAKPMPDDLDDGAPSVRPGASPAPAPAARKVASAAPAHKPVQGLDDLDDGAPSVPPGAAPAPAPVARKVAPAPTAPKTPAGLGDLDDGAPSVTAPSGTPPAPAPTGSASPVPTPTPTPPAPTDSPLPGAAAAPDRESVVAKVTALMAEKTGYPLDMLEPDLDLESDLGIDTVKQAEIFGEVRGLFGLPLPEGLNLADYPTIARVADFVLEHTSGAALAKATSPAPVTGGTEPEPPAPVRDTPPAKTEAAAHPVRRMVVVPVDAPADKAPPREVKVQGPVLLTQDRLDWAPMFARRLAEDGIQVVLLGAEEPTEDVPGFFVPTDLTDVTSIERAVQTVRERLGPIGGILHLAGLGATHEPDDEPHLREEMRGAVRSLYAIARAAREDLAARPGVPILAVTRMGGRFGMVDPGTLAGAADLFDPVNGGVAGATKALAKEIASAHVRVVDLGVDMGPADAARCVWSETKRDDRRVEVGHPEVGTRIGLDVVPRPTLRATMHPMFADDHIVVTGGGQGITAACIEALIDQVGKDRAPAVTILGRTELPDDVAALAALDDAALDAKKKALLAQLKASHDRVTPVMLEKEWTKTTKAIEVHQTMDRLRDLGARVSYHALDVRDARAVQAAVTEARAAHGPVTGIVHGAGIEISKQLADKDPDQFDLVFDIKALGMMHLLAATATDPLRQVAVFSSVAGRFGNLGQIDYSAANDLAVHAAIAAGRRRGFRGFGIDWTAWGDVGMATRGGIALVMEQAGVTMIPPDVGTRHFVEEWLGGDVHPEVVIAGALGAIDQDGQVRDEALPPGPAPVAGADASDRPLVDAFLAVEPGRFALAARRLDLQQDRYLEDHRVDGVPFLPGVYGVEMFAEVAQAALEPPANRTPLTFVGATDVTFATPVKLLRDRPLDVRVAAERLPDRDGHVRFACRLESDFVNERGEVLGDVRVHFEGVVAFGAARARPVRQKPLPTGGAAQVLFGHDDVYDHFFHGPTFQVLDHVARIEGPHIAAVARFEHDELLAADAAPRFLTAPMAREAAFQAAGFWAMAEKGRMSLPAAIGTVEHFGMPRDAPVGTSFVVLARHERDLPDGVHAEYTVETYTPEGALVDRMAGYRMITIGTHEIARRDRHPDHDAGPSATQPPVPARPADAASAPRADPASSGRGGDVEVAEDDDGDWEMLARSGDPPAGDTLATRLRLGDVDAARVAVDQVAGRLADPGFLEARFTPAERARLAGLRVGKRRHEHAAGMLAAKAALGAAWRTMTGAPPPVFELTPDPETRAPTWRALDVPTPGWTVSISHSGPHAVAAVATDGEGLGIDIERIAVRADSFLDTAFASDERDLITRLAGRDDARVADWATRFWTVKEAVAKGLRTGLALDLHSVRVRDIDAAGQVRVDLMPAAAALLPPSMRIVARSAGDLDGFAATSVRFVPDA